MIVNTGILIVFATLAASAADALGTNKWVDACKHGKYHKMKKVDCEAMGPAGLLECLSSSKHDKTMAAAIRRCPHKLPATGADFDRVAMRLYESGNEKAFRALIGYGRCTQLTPGAVQNLLGSFVNNQHSVPFVRAMVRHCILGNAAWSDFMAKAQAHGRGELLVVVRETPPSPSAVAVAGGPPDASSAPPVVPAAAQAPPPAASAAVVSPVSGASDTFPAGPLGGLVAGSAPSPHDMGAATAREEYDAAQKRMAVMRAANITGTAAAPMAAGVPAQPVLGPYTGELLRITPEFVAAHPNILAQITPCQARKFGLLSCGCMGLTDAHFRAPGVSSRVVARLPLNCFQKIPPAAFAGMTACMVARLRWWPYVTREQVSYVPVGDPIRALPFDMLGMGRQKSADDKMHPCWAITRDQLASIRKSTTARREYYRRCIKSSAAAVRVFGTLLVAALALGVAALA